MNSVNVTARRVISVIVTLTAAFLIVCFGNRLTASIGTEGVADDVPQEIYDLFPDGEKAKKLDLSAQSIPESITEVYTDGEGTAVFRMEVRGYAPGMVILCTIENGKIKNAICSESRETLGREKTYGETLVGKDLSTIGTVETVSGATYTTTAYKDAVADALECYNILKSEVEKQ